MAVVKQVNLKDFAQELGAFNEEQMAAFRQAVTNGVAQSIPELVKNSPVDTGLYASSWDFTVDEQAVILGNYAPHADIIEFGARPFTPPLGPLLAWAKRVLQDSSQPPKYSPEVWRLAVGTQNKIAREGMQPRSILQDQIPAVLENIRIEYEELVK